MGAGWEIHPKNKPKRRTKRGLKADIIRLLEKAASDRSSPMHTPVVTTADADARIMVLRAFDEENWILRFNTDARAPKVESRFPNKRQAISIAIGGPARPQAGTM